MPATKTNSGGSGRRVWSYKSKGSSPDLMPSIMGALDAFLDTKPAPSEPEEPPKPAAAPKRVNQVGNFPNLSANVQKILANVPDDECTNPSAITSSSQEPKRFVRSGAVSRSQRYSPEKKIAHKSNESLDIISPNVQKMLSNLPDTELVLGSTVEERKMTLCVDDGCCLGRTFELTCDNNFGDINCNVDNKDVEKKECFASADDECSFTGRPLGTYLHKSSSGIASRTPVGRKNLGKYLQIPSESTNSTLSSEVSRPVSLTSLGSCSSSSSSGLHQQGSAYLASAESLDSDVEPTGSQGSADSGIAESITMSPELRVLQEVLDTETVYVNDLHEVINGYLEPWRNDPECPLQQHLPHLFSNLEEIYEFNRSFLQDLRAANCDPTKTANVFLHSDSGFSVYTEYCTSYPRTMNILTELTRDERMAPMFRERQTALSHALPLGSYLLKPVQRILKYHLLLQRLSKQCDSSHKPAVDLALATMTSVAMHINTMKRKHEHAVRVQEIQSQLYGWSGPDLTALGELIAEGAFRVGGARGRRHVFLFDKLLLMAKSKPDGALAYKTHVMCSNLMLVEQVRGEPLCFHILPFDNPRLQCTLRARSAQHKREWTLQIKRVILENYSAVIPNHARQLVMQLGQDVEETTEDQNEKWSPIKQHSTPQYLERRSRVRKTRDYSNRRAASQDRTFPSLGNWRRKSDPSGIQQYNTKTVPKKITKIKKAKECATVFYTDLSDSENCDAICASMDCLNVSEESGRDVETELLEKNGSIAQVVSDLLMQNEEFHKLLNRRRRNLRDVDKVSTAWNKQDEKLPCKSDSLPRSFQLNEKKDQDELSNLTISESSTSLQDTRPVPEDIHEAESNSQMDDDFPEHKIYRKSTIRFSLLQRFRAMLNEEQRKNKMPIYKQGSKSMGAKIANADYVDPQKLLSTTSLNSNQSNGNDKIEFDDYDLLDMTINENEVLNELDRRLSQSSKNETETDETDEVSRPGKSVSLQQINTTSASEKLHYIRSSSDVFNSSQNSDSYYESLLDISLQEEEKKIEKSDSFRSARESFEVAAKLTKPEIRRPTKAPPPIPVKPKYLSHKQDNNKSTNGSLEPAPNHNVNQKILSYSRAMETCSSTIKNEHYNQNSKGWVKTIVDRFE